MKAILVYLCEDGVRRKVNMLSQFMMHLVLGEHRHECSMFVFIIFTVLV